MASLSSHKIIEVWRFKDTETRYHVTETGRLLRTTGPRNGGAKIVMQKLIDGAFTFRVGVSPGDGWTRADADIWKQTAISKGYRCLKS
jgi:hypothetical protein